MIIPNPKLNILDFDSLNWIAIHPVPKELKKILLRICHRHLSKISTVLKKNRRNKPLHPILAPKCRLSDYKYDYSAYFLGINYLFCAVSYDGDILLIPKSNNESEMLLLSGETAKSVIKYIIGSFLKNH